MTEPLLTVRGLSLRFRGVTALDDVSFEVRPRELLAIIGPNGAGKTSIFNCLSGVYRPAAGSIRMGSTELVGRRPWAVAGLGVARTFQNLALFPTLDVVDNLMLGRHHLMRTGFAAGAVWRGRARREELAHRRRCEEIVDLLELGPYRRSKVGVLPFGVRRRIELGRALAMEPRLLLLDEPVAGMNAEETEDIARQVRQVRAALDLAVILVEHDLRFVMGLADRVLALDFGRVLVTGLPGEVQANPEVVRAYIGQAS